MRKIIAAIVIIASVNSLVACDICGGSLSGNPFGILPLVHKNFLGFRYQYHSFHTNHPTILNESGVVSSDAVYGTYQLWGRFIPVDGLQLFALVPYNSYQKTEESVNSTLSGIGDISILANLVILNSANKKDARWKQALQAGGGIKLPTGNSTITESDEAISPSFKSGTGSFDFPLNVIYTLRYNKLGLNNELNYQINTPNKENYKFGNSFKYSMSLFYLYNLRQLSFIPNIGMNYEKAGLNTKNSYIQSYTGGSSVFINAGLDIYYKSFSIGFNIQKPVYQNVGDHSFVSNAKVSANLLYQF